MNTVDSVVRYMQLMPQHTWVWDNWGGAMLIARSSLGKTRGRQQWKDASLHQCILPRIAMRPYRLSSWVVRSGVLRRTSRYRRERTRWGEKCNDRHLIIVFFEDESRRYIPTLICDHGRFQNKLQSASLSGLSPDTMCCQLVPSCGILLCVRSKRGWCPVLNYWGFRIGEVGLCANAYRFQYISSRSGKMGLCANAYRLLYILLCHFLLRWRLKSPIY